MLYYIFDYLEELGVPGSHLWGYVSFRAILAMGLALVISIWFGEKFILYMKRRGGVEVQRDAKTDPFGVTKKGVPTMGGIIIIVATVVPCLLVGSVNLYMILMLVTTLWLGAIGLADDIIKMRGNKDGLRPAAKLAGQAALGLGIGLTLWLSPQAVVREQNTDEVAKSTITTIPFVKDNNLNYADMFDCLGQHKRVAGWAFFVVMATLVMVAVSNGSNLNDGMDGMCAGNSAIMALALAVLAYVSSHVEMASYLNIMYIPHSEEVVIFLLAFTGALTGFLWYNAYPAQVFMGDTGSLSIGGIIGVAAIIIHKELLIPVICFVFLAESLSVLLQTAVARQGNKRGQKWRLVKRAPIHDTFRVRRGDLPADFRVALNWPRGAWLESKITTRFWIVTIIMALTAIVTLKIR